MDEQSKASCSQRAKPAGNESEASSSPGAGLRILCVGRIHRGVKTMIIAFPERRKDHAAIPQGTEEKGEA